MKIAIQGHPTRGKEVIQILESLDGINQMDHTGKYTDYFYYISSDDNTIAWTCIRPKSNVYTLEEFEKEFPFKIGDKVIHSHTPNFIGTVVDIKFDDHISYRVDIDGKIYTCGTTSLKLYKEMKEERNITLTLDKAKEWYNKSGELKEIALQAYSEEELTKVELPKTWKEFCEKYPVKIGETWVGSYDTIYSATMTQSRIYKNWIPSRRSAGAHLAMIQLEQLRDCWRQGWEPEWNNEQQSKYCIVCYQEKFKVSILYTTKRFLSFPTKEMAEEFLECFRDLIEKAGDLI